MKTKDNEGWPQKQKALDCVVFVFFVYFCSNQLTLHLVNAIYNTMKTMLTIDRAGRVVLPKAVRNRFRLTPGTSMNLRVESDAIVLMPQQTTSSVIQDGTLLIHQGVATGDLLAAVEASRDLRDHDLHRLQE